MRRKLLLLEIYFFCLVLTLPCALSSPQLFQYYQSKKYTISRPWRGKINALDSSEFENFSDQQKEIPKDEIDLFNGDGTVHDPATNSLSISEANTIAGSDLHERGDGNRNQISTSTELEEGSFCRRTFDGRSGYCLVSYQCLHVMRDYREHGVKIDICTYRRNIPVICCPLAEKHVEQQSISVKKCRQYNEDIQGIKFNLPLKLSGKTCVASLPMIVGGRVANEGEYPHMAALGWSQDNKAIIWGCGGTLISDSYVLTAAHCATSGENPPDVVRLGASNLNENSTSAQEIGIHNITLHPNYRTSNYYHDIALIKLVRRVKIIPTVRPACLWQLPDIDMPAMVATGWGRTSFRGSRSETLRKVNLKVIDESVCHKLYNKERRLPEGISNEQFCAGHLVGGKDTCQGDSGGPLHAELPELKCVKFVVGITSFGKFCAESNAPGIYLKVYPYLDWIESIAFA